MKDVDAFLGSSDFIDESFPMRPPSPNPDYLPQNPEDRDLVFVGHRWRIAAWQDACDQRAREIATRQAHRADKKQRISRSGR